MATSLNNPDRWGASWPPVGKKMATSGEKTWPRMGRNRWPPGAFIGVLWRGELALRDILSLSPTPTDGANARRGAERGPAGATARPRCTTSAGVARRCAVAPPTVGWSPWAETVAPRANLIRETGRLRTMTSIKRDDLERKRREPGRDGTGRRLSPAIGARQRLSATQRSADRNSASHFGPRDPRFDYLTHSHD